jgi:hypothetical protein
MKKAWWSLALVLALLVIPLVYADDQPSSGEFGKSLNASREANVAAIKEKSDEVAEKQINLPTWAEPIVKFLIRLEEPFTLSHLIIAVALFVLLSVILIDILQLFSAFTDRTSAIVGILLTVIISSIGVIKSITICLINKGNVVKWLEGWSAGALVFWLIVIVLATFGLSKVFRIAHDYKLLRLAKKEGLEAGAELAFVRWVKNTYTGMANWVKS